MMNGENNNMAGSTSQLVECPRCGNRFELSETFRAHFEAEMRKEFDNALRDSEAKIRAEAEQASKAERVKSEKQVKDLQVQLQTNQEAQEKREAEIRAEAEQASKAERAESENQIRDLQVQLRANQEAQEKREAEIRVEAEKKASSEYEIKRGKWDNEKQRLEKRMADMQRQLEQKPAELQGEALEAYLKRQLQTEFPVDRIEDIKRGQYGADLTQEVFDGQLGACGIVVWEAKRTKRWNNNWLAKIKTDADRVGTHLRVIVSETLPTEIRNFGLKEGVWVSNLECALPLAQALRLQLIEGTRLQRARQGMGLKMDEIYQYLTSQRFGERIQLMVDTWIALEKQVDTEERSMNRQWKERRKQLARIRNSTIEMFTDFSNILGQEIAQVPGLELEALPPGDNVDVIEQ